MTPAQKTAWTLIVFTPLAIGLGLLLLSLNRSPQFIVFSNGIEQIDFTTSVDTWSLPAAGIVALQVTQCELALGAGSVKPQPGSSMRVDLVRPLNLQVNGGGKLDITVAAPTIAQDVGLTWTMKSSRVSTFSVVLFADTVTIRSPANQVWKGPQPTTPQSASNGLEFTCQTSRKEGASIALVATATQPLLELGPQMTVEQPRLSAPRGQIAIGNTLLPLGAGELRIDGRMTLKPFRWAPSTSSVIEASVSGRTANVTMDGDQLIPSTLASFSQHPGWTAFAGVCAVVLGAFFSKLFDHAMT
jgi:hypothetical protein